MKTFLWIMLGIGVYIGGMIVFGFLVKWLDKLNGYDARLEEEELGMLFFWPVILPFVLILVPGGLLLGLLKAIFKE